MRLSQSWVDALFERLTVRYGATFLRQYADVSVDAVKADWAETLGGFDGSAIAYGIEHLAPLPPNATQFREICRRAPVQFAPMLEAPKADPVRVKKAIAAIDKSTRAEDPAVVCIRNIERAAERAPLTQSQRFVLEACKRKLAGAGGA